jgi:hypothetical protein
LALILRNAAAVAQRDDLEVGIVLGIVLFTVPSVDSSRVLAWQGSDLGVFASSKVLAGGESTDEIGVKICSKGVGAETGDPETGAELDDWAARREM